MDRKQAIETLRANYPDACYEQLREAVDAAIEALKAQDAAGDTISRQAAITEFNCCDLTPDGGIDVNDAIDFLKHMPSAQANKVVTRWEMVCDEQFPCRTCRHFAKMLQSQLQGTTVYPCDKCETITWDINGEATSVKTLGKGE